MIQFTCTRCSKLANIVLSNNTDPLDNDEVSIHADGMLVYVCMDCMTPDEHLKTSLKFIAEALDQAEHAQAMLEMIMSQNEDAKNDPKFQHELDQNKAIIDKCHAAMSKLMEQNDG